MFLEMLAVQVSCKLVDLMKKLLSLFSKSEDGFLISSELVILATITVIGLIVGIAEVRNQVVSELGDVALAFGQLDQTYTYDGTVDDTPGDATASTTQGSAFTDTVDASNGQAAATTAAGGVAVDVSATETEG